MAFMQPDYTAEAFVTVTEANGESYSFPADVFEGAHPDCDVEHHPAGKWWWRLSASGYMDCTDWIGPFETLDEARESVQDTFDVDPDTGEQLDETC